MTLLSLLLTVAIFFSVRFLVSLRVKDLALNNAVGAGAVLFFLGGVWAGAALFGNPAVPVPAAVAPAAPPAVPPVVPRPSITAISYARSSSLKAASGPSIHAVVDGLTTSLSVPYVQPGTPLGPGPAIFVRGWAVSSQNTPVKRLVFIFDRRLAYDGTSNYGQPRPDIAAAFKNSALSATGFTDVALPTKGLTKGTHLLQVGGVGGDAGRLHLSTVNVQFVLQ
jgi:hypothetical protein